MKMKGLLIVAHEDNTEVFLNGATQLIEFLMLVSIGLFQELNIHLYRRKSHIYKTSKSFCIPSHWKHRK